MLRTVPGIWYLATLIITAMRERGSGQCKKEMSRIQELNVGSGSTFLQRRYAMQMINKHMKRYSIPLAIRKTQIKPTVSSYPLEWLGFFKTWVFLFVCFLQGKKEQMLVKLWRNWNYYTLLLKM